MGRLRCIVVIGLFLLAGTLQSFAQAPTTASAARSGAAPQIEEQFLRGMALQQAGQSAQAARVFADILASDPGLVRVRLELALAYFNAEEWQRARAEFLSVLSADLPEPVRARVLAFIRAIDGRRGFEWNLSVSIAQLGDSRRFDTDEIDLDFGSGPLPSTLDRNQETALGLAYSAGVSIRRPIRSWSTSTVAVSGFGQLALSGEEGPGRRFDDTILSADAGARVIWNQTTFSAAPMVSRRFLQGNAFEDRVGIVVAAERRGARGTSLATSVAWRNVDNLTRSDLDGEQVNVFVRFARPLSTDTTVGASLSFEDKSVDFDLDNYQATRVTVFGAFDVRGGLTLRPSAFAEYKTFRTPSPLFTASPDESTLGVGLRLESTRIIVGNGFTPFLDADYSRTTTDIAAFRSRDYSVSVGLERRF